MYQNRYVTNAFFRFHKLFCFAVIGFYSLLKGDARDFSSKIKFQFFISYVKIDTFRIFANNYNSSDSHRFISDVQNSQLCYVKKQRPKNVFDYTLNDE